MKRPEGFDRTGKAASPTTSGGGSAKTRSRRTGETNAAAAPTSARANGGTPPTPRQQPPASAASTAAAERERRRRERREARRFTRHARSRRTGLLIVIGTVLALVGVFAIALFSPLLALRTITVDGTSRVDAEEVTAALSDQLGTPLALLDYGRITEELGAFPLIRSYVTETVPPHTLVVHIQERQPVGELLAGGKYLLVDPAGVVVQESATRIGGTPIIDLGGADASDPAFEAAVQVLLAMPASLRSQVDSITATTQDDVNLVLVGVGQRVKWGSAENSEKKAIVLSRLIAITDPKRAGTFDVSAPGNAIFSPS